MLPADSRYGAWAYTLLTVLSSSYLLTEVRGQDPKMCSSLDNFVDNTNRVLAQCERDINCTVVSCTVNDAVISQVILNSQTTFLPCLTPPAISLLFLRPNGSVFSNHLVSQTMEVPLLSTPFSVDSFDTILHLSLHVNISHTPPDYLQVETDIIQRIVGVPSPSVMPLNNLTYIMLDPSSCEGVGPDLATPTTLSPSIEPKNTTDGRPSLGQEATSKDVHLSASTILIIPFLLLTSSIIR